MFNRETILKNLNAENYYVDKHSLDLFLHDWKIDSIYEDDDGLEFFDDLSFDKIKRGISLKAQGYSDEQIIAKLKRMEAKPADSTKIIEPIMVKDYLNIKEDEISDVEVQNDISSVNDINSINESNSQKEKCFTLDVSSQTLQMLAEAVAKKISDDITNSDMATRLIEAGGYKRDNEILAEQIKTLLEHNKKLSARIEELENKSNKTTFWGRFWGQK